MSSPFGVFERTSGRTGGISCAVVSRVGRGLRRLREKNTCSIHMGYDKDTWSCVDSIESMLNSMRTMCTN